MKRAYLKYIFALLLFGSNGVVASHIELTSYEIVLLRSLSGSLLLIAIFFLSRRKLNILRYKKDTLCVAISGVAMAANWLFLFEAFTQIGVSMSMLINYTGPAIIMVLSPLIFKERITLPKMAALLLALLGVFLVSGQAVIEGLNGRGLLCAGLSAFAYAAMVIFNMMSKKTTGIENATLQLLFTFIGVSVFVFLKQGLYMEIASGDWLPILWLGLVNTGVGCYFYFSSIGKLPVQTVAICGYLEPLSAVVFSVLFLKETMLPLQIIGAILILGGAIFGEKSAQGGQVQQAQ